MGEPEWRLETCPVSGNASGVSERVSPLDRWGLNGHSGTLLTPDNRTSSGLVLHFSCRRGNQAFAPAFFLRYPYSGDRVSFRSPKFVHLPFLSFCIIWRVAHLCNGECGIARGEDHTRAGGRFNSRIPVVRNAQGGRIRPQQGTVRPRTLACDEGATLAKTNPSLASS
jgi:hypothetical protein